MTNHYHLLVETPQANLISGMRCFRPHTRCATIDDPAQRPFFQGRYKSMVVDSEERSYFATLIDFRVGPRRRDRRDAPCHTRHREDADPRALQQTGPGVPRDAWSILRAPQSASNSCVEICRPRAVTRYKRRERVSRHDGSCGPRAVVSLRSIFLASPWISIAPAMLRSFPSLHSYPEDFFALLLPFPESVRAAR